MSDSIHKNHRKRMMMRYAKEGFSGFSDHELFEMLLYFSQPRIDTNPAAHALIERFGSLQGVMNASYEKLCGTQGIGATSAMLIKLCIELERRYLMANAEPGVSYDTLGKIANFLYPYFHGLDHECFYMLMFNNRMNLLDCVLVSKGAVNFAGVQMRKMVEHIVDKNAAAIVLAHNHPNGLTIPSKDDCDLTQSMQDFFSRMKVVIVEHMIFADDRFSCIMRRECGVVRASPLSNRVDSAFYTHFYGEFEDEMVLRADFPCVSSQD